MAPTFNSQRPATCATHGQPGCQECIQDWVETEAIFEESGRKHRDAKRTQAERRTEQPDTQTPATA